MSIFTVGIYFAKNEFAVHGVGEHGKAALVKPNVARENEHSRRSMGGMPTAITDIEGS